MCFWLPVITWGLFLYIGWDKNGTVYIASELKALEGTCTKIELFLQGITGIAKTGGKMVRPDWMDYDRVKDNSSSIDELHDALEAAVKRQLMSDVPYGVLLSGGLDSSITQLLRRSLQI